MKEIAGLVLALVATCTRAQTVAWDVPLTRLTTPTALPGDGTPHGGHTLAIDAAGRSQQVGHLVEDPGAVFVASYATDGSQRWFRVLDDLPGQIAGAIATTPSGESYVATSARRDAARDVFLTKLDAGGEIAWRRTVAVGDDDRAYDVALAPDGGAYVVVAADRESATPSIALRRYAADGTPLWTRGVAAARPAGLVAAANGEVTIAANGSGGGLRLQRWNADGDFVLAFDFPEPASAMAIDATNGAVYVGTSAASADPHVLVAPAGAAAVAVSPLPVTLDPAVQGARITGIAADGLGSAWLALHHVRLDGTQAPVAARLDGPPLRPDFAVAGAIEVGARSTGAPIRGLAAARGARLYVAFEQGDLLTRRVDAIEIDPASFEPRSSARIGEGPDTALFAFEIASATDEPVLQIRADGAPDRAVIARYDDDLRLRWSSTIPQREVGLQASYGPRTLAAAADGDVVHAGTAVNDAETHGVVERRTATGAVRWSRTLDPYGREVANDLVLDAAGDVHAAYERFVPGYAENGYVYAKLAGATGAVLVGDVRAVGVNGYPIGLAPNALGGYSVAYRTLLETPVARSALAFARYGANGAFAGDLVHAGPSDASPLLAVGAGDGATLVHRVTGTHSRVARYAIDGTPQWDVAIDGMTVLQLVGDASGVYLAARGGGANPPQLRAIKLERDTGVVAWSTAWDEAPTASANGAVLAGGAFVVTGSFGNPVQGYVARYDAGDGTLLGRHVTDEAAAVLVGIAANADGEVYAAGASIEALTDVDADVLVLKLDAHGAAAWQLKHRPANGTAEATRIVAAPGRALYVEAAGDVRGEPAALRLLRIEEPPLGDAVFASGFE